MYRTTWGRARFARAPPCWLYLSAYIFDFYIDFYMCIYIKTYSYIEFYYKYMKICKHVISKTFGLISRVPLHRLVRWKSKLGCFLALFSWHLLDCIPFCSILLLEETDNIAFFVLMNADQRLTSPDESRTLKIRICTHVTPVRYP